MAVDMIVTNAKVLTMDAAKPRAEAVAVAGGKIVAVGMAADVVALVGPDTRVIDAGGRSLLPGFVESHLHLVLGGAEQPGMVSEIGSRTLPTAASWHLPR